MEAGETRRQLNGLKAALAATKEQLAVAESNLGRAEQRGAEQAGRTTVKLKGLEVSTERGSLNPVLRELDGPPEHHSASPAAPVQPVYCSQDTAFSCCSEALAGGFLLISSCPHGAKRMANPGRGLQMCWNVDCVPS